MRNFKIIEQAKEWLLDLDGNYYHQTLRKNLEIGMVVGVRITEREIPSNERIKIIDNFKDYLKLHNEYIKFLELENELKSNLKIEIQKKIDLLNSEIEDHKRQIKDLDQQIVELKKVIKMNDSNRDERIKEVKQKLKLKASYEKLVSKKKRNLSTLNTAMYNPLYKKGYLIKEHNFPEELFGEKLDFSRFEELENLFFETTSKERPYEETIFFKIVKIVGEKIYGDVLDHYRRKDTKCPLKTGDRISFRSKNILFVPKEFNRESNIKKYILSDYNYKFYRAVRITDWDGVFLDLEAKKSVVPGSIVRFQLLEESTRRSFIYYVYVLDEVDNYLIGEILDYYLVTSLTLKDPVKIGCIFKFSRDSITEIPLMWNPHLSHLKKFRDKDNYGFPITGYRADDAYFDLTELQ